MKIAIVAPSPVPYATGGMERLVRDMATKINGLTEHQAELIKLPSREHNFWDLVQSYRDFTRLDLSHFDMVISTKYPSWMVSHPNHVCYMVHRLRGLYDTYFMTGMGLDVKSTSPYTDALLECLDNKPDMPDFWEAFDVFKEHAKDIPAFDLTFPGPLARRIIHYLDDYALDPSRIRRYVAMSSTVRRRAGYFPEGVSVEVINPPPSNTIGIEDVVDGDYLFTVSRLDGAKRVYLLVEAMKHVKSNAKLVIAGTGPDEKLLREMADENDRIEFKGYCNDDTVSKLYANCLAVPYVPYDEDYGLVTIEAFLRRKPVITCIDSGGTTEFVTNGENGLIVKPDALSLAEAIDRIYNNTREARAMGHNGLKRINQLTWENFIPTLIRADAATNSELVEPRKKLLVLTTFPVYPPRGGGQIRIYNLYKHLAEHMDVDILSFTSFGQPFYSGMLAPGLRETRIPESELHHREEMRIERIANIPVTDVAMPRLSRLTPAYGEELRRKAAVSDILVVCHPFLYDEVERAHVNIPIIYDAQDVEYDIKSQYIKNSNDLLEDVRRVEKSCCKKSKLVIACSEGDADRFVELYHIERDKVHVVPNGVDTGRTYFVSGAERKKNKADMGLNGETVALFMGSWHPPNLDACREIFRIAKDMPRVKFLLIGSQCQALQHENIPANIGLMGVISDEEKSFILGTADIALNPMRTGSGTNLKIFDYMAAGIPVITTRFGARGIANAEQYVYLADSIEYAEQAINDLTRTEDEVKQINARRMVESAFDWKVLSKGFLDKLGNL